MVDLQIYNIVLGEKNYLTKLYESQVMFGELSGNTKIIRPRLRHSLQNEANNENNRCKKVIAIVRGLHRINSRWGRPRCDFETKNTKIESNTFTFLISSRVKIDTNKQSCCHHHTDVAVSIPPDIS